MYRGNPSIADRMRVLDFKASLLRKQDGEEGQTGTAAMPAGVSPPIEAPPAPPMGGAEPSPDDMMAAQNAQVYGSNEEALADAHSRLTEIAVDLTNHLGTIDMQATMDNLQMDLPDRFGEHITELRNRVEGLCKIIKIIRSQNPEMVGHGAPGADMGMDPMMASQGEMPPQNMPAPGPAGMPPGGMPMPGPMMGGM